MGPQLCSSYIRNVQHYTLRTLGFVLKKQKYLIFHHQVMNSLILDFPYAWKRSDLTLHLPYEGYILSHCEALEEEKL